MPESNIQNAHESALPPKTAKAKLSAKKKAVFSFALILALFLCAEGILRLREFMKYGQWSTERLLNKGEKELYITHPYLGRIPRPNLDMDYRGHHIQINSLGFRGPEISLKKEEGVFRVACLGASTTFCADAKEEKETWPRRLELLLNEKIRSGQIQSFRRIEVINAGVPGYCSIESQINYALRVSSLNPDLIFVYEAYNDLVAYTGADFKADYSHWRNTPAHKPGKDRKRANIFFEYSMTLIKLNQYFSRLGQAKEEEKLHEQRGKLDTVPDQGVNAFKSHLLKLGRCANSDGAKVVLSTFASLYADVGPEPDEESQKRILAAQSFFHELSVKGVTDGLVKNNDALQSLGLSEGWPVFDGRGALGKDSALFADEIHMNSAGMEKFATALADFLQREGLIQK